MPVACPHYDGVCTSRYLAAPLSLYLVKPPAFPPRSFSLRLGYLKTFVNNSFASSMLRFIGLDAITVMAQSSLEWLVVCVSPKIPGFPRGLIECVGVHVEAVCTVAVGARRAAWCAFVGIHRCCPPRGMPRLRFAWLVGC